MGATADDRSFAKDRTGTGPLAVSTYFAEVGTDISFFRLTAKAIDLEIKDRFQEETDLEQHPRIAESGKCRSSHEISTPQRQVFEASAQRQHSIELREKANSNIRRLSDQRLACQVLLRTPGPQRASR